MHTPTDGRKTRASRRFDCSTKERDLCTRFLAVLRGVLSVRRTTTRRAQNNATHGTHDTLFIVYIFRYHGKN